MLDLISDAFEDSPMVWLGTLLAAVLVWWLLGPLFALWQSRRSLGRAAPDTGALDGLAASARRRLYYFHSPHCGACRPMTAMVDRLRQSHPNLIKVDVGNSLGIAREFGIAATPTWVLVEDGAIRQVKLGGQSERALLGLLTGDAP